MSHFYSLFLSFLIFIFVDFLGFSCQILFISLCHPASPLPCEVSITFFVIFFYLVCVMFSFASSVLSFLTVTSCFSTGFLTTCYPILVCIVSRSLCFLSCPPSCCALHASVLIPHISVVMADIEHYFGTF